MARRKSKKTSAPETPPPPRPLQAEPTNKFKQDVERLKKRGKDMDKLRAIIESLGRTGHTLNSTESAKLG